MTRKDADYSDWGQIEEKNESIIDVLDKIRNEITMLQIFNRQNVIEIIDKYRAERTEE